MTEPRGPAVDIEALAQSVNAGVSDLNVWDEASERHRALMRQIVTLALTQRDAEWRHFLTSKDGVDLPALLGYELGVEEGQRKAEQRIARLEAPTTQSRQIIADLTAALRQAVAAIQRDDVETPTDEWASALRRAQAYLVSDSVGATGEGE